MDPFSLILILVLLFFAYYKKRESDGEPLQLPPWLNQILGVEEDDNGGSGGGGGDGPDSSRRTGLQVGDQFIGSSLEPGSSWDITASGRGQGGGKVTGGTEEESINDCEGAWGWSEKGLLIRDGGTAEQEKEFFDPKNFSFLAI